MRFRELLAVVGELPLFETGLLLVGDVDPADVRRQLSRWVAASRILQLRRGLYALAPPFRRVEPHPFLVANQLVRGSYVSLQSALAHHGLIPEHVPVVTSLGTGRPQLRRNAFGAFQYHHCDPRDLGGFELVDLGGGQQAFVAGPERALFDLVRLVPGADSPEYLDGLRLFETKRFDIRTLAGSRPSPKVRRAFARLAALSESGR